PRSMNVVRPSGRRPLRGAVLAGAPAEARGDFLCNAEPSLLAAQPLRFRHWDIERGIAACLLVRPVRHTRRGTRGPAAIKTDIEDRLAEPFLPPARTPHSNGCSKRLVTRSPSTRIARATWAPSTRFVEKCISDWAV